MKEKKTGIRLITVILSCLNAAGWGLLSILDMVLGYSNQILFILRLFCAVGWCIIALNSVLRYSKEKRNRCNEDDPS